MEKNNLGGDAGIPASKAGHDQHQLAAQREATDAAARADTVRLIDRQFVVPAAPAKAGSPSAPRMALHPNEHVRLMQQAAHLKTPPRTRARTA